MALGGVRLRRPLPLLPPPSLPPPPAPPPPLALGVAAAASDIWYSGKCKGCMGGPPCVAATTTLTPHSLTHSWPPPRTTPPRTVLYTQAGQHGSIAASGRGGTAARRGFASTLAPQTSTSTKVRYSSSTAHAATTTTNISTSTTHAAGNTQPLAPRPGSQDLGAPPHSYQCDATRCTALRCFALRCCVEVRYGAGSCAVQQSEVQQPSHV
ncbi:hypothetical protein E2C01_083931 [Portunus trituberculatus]|uniref:Uncharacterized protein n=1 Tax=Portunus trituberculatus TaxID=210409 RepID=A0A5B7J3I8_PORTR|nr:hypothetical protein [Portunus trituberculatus]